jgi:hypothetical protein
MVANCHFALLDSGNSTIHGAEKNQSRHLTALVARVALFLVSAQRCRLHIYWDAWQETIFHSTRQRQSRPTLRSSAFTSLELRDTADSGLDTRRARRIHENE